MSHSAPILIAGASGVLGGTISRRLLASGHRVRALGRSRERLQPLGDAGAEVVVADLQDPAAVVEACRGVDQLVSTAVNVLGRGATSPTRIDVPAYRTLAAAARAQGVGRWVHLSGAGIGADSIVDLFRVKHQVDEVVRGSGVPCVLLRPTAFMETWIDLILATPMRKDGVVTLFGDGSRIVNYVAVDDVADVVVAILGRPEVRNEVIAFGGPSEVSVERLVALLEAAMGTTVKRRRVPVAVLRAGSILLRPFNEVTARMMALGAFSAMADARCPEWRATADRFGVEPRSVERYIGERFGSAAGRGET